MKFDWQTIAVAIIVACAFLYVARRGLARLRSFTARGGAACATGCGKCGEVTKRETSLEQPVLVRISRQPRRRAPTK